MPCNLAQLNLHFILIIIIKGTIFLDPGYSLVVLVAGWLLGLVDGIRFFLQVIPKITGLNKNISEAKEELGIRVDDV